MEYLKKTMKKVNLTEITEAMESLGYTASYSAGKVIFKNKNGDRVEVKDTDTLVDVLSKIYFIGQCNPIGSGWSGN